MSNWHCMLKRWLTPALEARSNRLFYQILLGWHILPGHTTVGQFVIGYVISIQIDTKDVGGGGVVTSRVLQYLCIVINVELPPPLAG